MGASYCGLLGPPNEREDASAIITCSLCPTNSDLNYVKVEEMERDNTSERGVVAVSLL